MISSPAFWETPAAHAGQREQAEPREEQPFVAVPVAEPARWHERQAEGQRVSRDHPFQGTGARVRALLDARQRHVDDRGVQDGHEGAGQHDREDLPAAFSRVSVGHRCPLPLRKHRKRRQSQARYPERTQGECCGLSYWSPGGSDWVWTGLWAEVARVKQ
jgi:hypothetical protein